MKSPASSEAACTASVAGAHCPVTQNSSHLLPLHLTAACRHQSEVQAHDLAWVDLAALDMQRLSVTCALSWRLLRHDHRLAHARHLWQAKRLLRHLWQAKRLLRHPLRSRRRTATAARQW
eukprot:6491730-Amphidinium_carterae.1